MDDTEKDEITIFGTQSSGIDDRLIGAQLDSKYKILERLGGGGMGVVYRGEHTLMDRVVAIKVLRSQLIEDGEQEKFFARFQQEARASSKIQHSNAVAIYDFGVHENFPFLVMQYVDGRPLKDVLKEDGPLALDVVAKMLKEIGGALNEAHSKEIVHRDLKPDNIMIEQRANEQLKAYVVDFGIAKICGGSGSDLGLTKTGAIVGTPQYMSPEQVQGQQVDKRSDIYSLGIMLYEMVTGEVPFQADSAVSVLMKHISEKPMPCRKFKPELKLPSGVESAVMRSIEKDPAHRQQSILQLVEEFCGAVERGTVTARSPLTAQPVSGTLSMLAPVTAKLRASRLLAGILVALVAGGAILGVSRSLRPSEEVSEVEIIQTVISEDDDNIEIVSMSDSPLEADVQSVSLEEENPVIRQSLEKAIDFHKAKKLSEAVGAYMVVLDLQPENVKALTNLGDVYVSRGDNEKAVAVLEKAALLDPGSTRVLANLGYAYGRLERWTEAVSTYEKSVQLQPDYALAHNNLGHAYSKLGKLALAEAAYLKATELDKSYSRAFHNLGDLYETQGNLDNAIRFHRLGAESSETNYRGYRKLGDVLVKAKKKAEARTAYEKALSIKPDDTSVKKRLRSLQ